MKSYTKVFSPVPLTGVRNLTIVNPRQELIEPNIEIKVINAFNTLEGHSTKKYHKKGECVGYIINVDGYKIYHSGDTDIIPDMFELGKIDIAFMPISGIYVMDLEEAVKATEIINPTTVIPMHEFDSRAEEFANRINEKAKTKALIVKAGESLLF